METWYRLALPNKLAFAFILDPNNEEASIVKCALNVGRECRTQLEGVVAIEEEWTEAMGLARSCLPDEQANYHSMIVERGRSLGLGLGPNKKCKEAAAYVAYMVASEGPSKIPRELASKLVANPTIRDPDPERYDVTSENQPDPNLAQYAVVWHVSTGVCKGWFHEDEARAEKRFKQLVNGPCVAMIFKPNGEEWKRWGHYGQKHSAWKQMKQFAQRRQGPGHGSAQAAPPRSRSRSPRRHDKGFSEQDTALQENVCCKNTWPAEYKFCPLCGDTLEDDVEVLDDEVDWEEIRAWIAEQPVRTKTEQEDGQIKQEDGEEDDGQEDDGPKDDGPENDGQEDDGGVEKVSLGRDTEEYRVLGIQRSISPTFTKGGWLQDLIDRLESKEVHPMEDDFLVLNMAKATWYVKEEDEHTGVKTRKPRTRYYTLDHRRLYCMWHAGVRQFRAKIVLQGPVFNEFARKARYLGSELETLHRKLQWKVWEDYKYWDWKIPKPLAKADDGC
eukprot:s200_g46.t1